MGFMDSIRKLTHPYSDAEDDYDEYDLLYGPILRREKSINFMDMLNKKADKLYEIIQKYQNKDDEQYKILCNQLEELEYIIDN